MTNTDTLAPFAYRPNRSAAAVPMSHQASKSINNDASTR